MSANPAEYPPGFIDPDIKVGDKVSIMVCWAQSHKLVMVAEHI